MLLVDPEIYLKLQRSTIGFNQLIYYHKYFKCADYKIHIFDKPLKNCRLQNFLGAKQKKIIYNRLF